MSKHKHNNYVNYYAKSTYETTNDTSSNEEVKNFEYTKTLFDDIPEEPEVEEVVQEPEPKIPPEEKTEKVDPKPIETIVLNTNLYIREKPYGDKVQKDELDRIIASKVIKDSDGWAIVPKETKTEVYDMMVHKDGSIWYATRFGYLLGKNKHGKKYVK